MNVPRGTKPADSAAPVVRRLTLSKEMLCGVAIGTKTTHRLVVDHGNSTVKPGSFAGLDLESGRGALPFDGPVIRARCRFESGDVRVVSVRPTIKPGDLFWVTGSGGNLPRSTETFEVSGINAGRLLDLGEEDALAEGVGPRDFGGVRHSPLQHYARLWNAHRRGCNYWRNNPWVWVLALKVHRCNVRSIIGTASGAL